MEQVKTIILKFLEEFRYVVKGMKMPKYIIWDIEVSSDESDKEDSEEEILMKKILTTKVLMKEIKIFCEGPI